MKNEVTAAMKRVFESQDGQTIMKYWDDMYANEISYVKGDSYETAFREGNREVVIEVKKRISNE